MNKKDKWIDFDTKLCVQGNTPKAKQLFKTVQESEDGQFESSTHDYCKSCYALYADVCKTVAKHFDLKVDSKKHWKTDEFKKAVTVFIEKIRVLTDIEKIKMLEEALIDISECLKKRMIHNKTCIRPKKGIQAGTSIGDPNHDGFIYDVCQEYMLLHEVYEYNIKLYTIYYKKTYSNIIERNYKNVLNNCSHRTRILSSEEGDKGKERSLSSISKSNSRSKSRSRSKSGRKSRYREYLDRKKTIRSHRKKDYKV